MYFPMGTHPKRNINISRNVSPQNSLYKTIPKIEKENCDSEYVQVDNNIVEMTSNFFTYLPLIIALIVNKTKFVGTTTVASNDCMARLRNLKQNKNNFIVTLKSFI